MSSRVKPVRFSVLAKKSFDPALTSLFASSLGPVTAPPKSRYQNLPENEVEDDDEELSEADEELEDEDEESDDGNDTNDSDSEKAQSDGGDESQSEGLDAEGAEVTGNDEDSSSEQSPSDNEAVLARIRETILNGEQERPHKKRKRGDKDADVEDVYLQKLAREEAKDEEKRKKKQKTVKALGSDDDTSSDSGSESETYEIPKHETQVDAKKDDDELEKAGRTVFLGNVSSEAITSKAAKKTLLRHLGSFFDDLADHNPPHKVESFRFRSTAFASALPKKAAFSKKEILDATTKSTNAYAVYSNKIAAREAVKQLNGTVVLNRHLRVDSVAHPAKVDNRRCVFVGNLGFVDDESTLAPAEEGQKKKNKPPGDVEEGLWVQFSKAGKVESVRVVRDSKTRVGKGIAYVQFEEENGVEAALQFNDQKFPPMLPRKLRVVRAKAHKKKATTSARHQTSKSPGKSVYTPKITPEQKSNQGRAKAMLGKAAAFKTAESFVFEGHRASSKQGKSGLKLGGGKKKGGKPTNRSSKRGAAWKAGGGKK